MASKENVRDVLTKGIENRVRGINIYDSLVKG